MDKQSHKSKTVDQFYGSGNVFLLHDLQTDSQQITISKQSTCTVIQQELFSHAIAERIITLVVESDATVTWYYQPDKNIDNLITHYRCYLQENSTLKMHQVAGNANMQKCTIELFFVGNNASAHVTGQYILNKKQNNNFITKQIHQAQNCRSSISIRGVLFDYSSADFEGLIVIESDAKKSYADQQHKVMLLSAYAQSNAKPQLEIKNNAVACKHGSAAGQVDHEQLFYLQSRGISLYYAKKMILLAFIYAINNVQHKSLEEKLHQLL